MSGPRRRTRATESPGAFDLFGEPSMTPPAPSLASRPLDPPDDATSPATPRMDTLGDYVLDPVPAVIPGGSIATAVPVSALTETAKDVLEGAFVPLWVRGEVCDFKAHRNGHWYFTLRDGAAQLRCVVWSRERRRIPAPPDDGMQVCALGQLTVYMSRGDLQLSVSALEAAGEGLIRKALELTLATISSEGLLDPARKRPLPRCPRRLAVVTSLDGAVLHDILAVVRRRCPTVEVLVVSAKVQGDGAPDELCAALDRLARCEAVDVAIIGRGGGGHEDLWAFNEERVVRAVAASRVPIISAVGHEIDTTLCDLVADLRAPTPSAAAEAATPVMADLQTEVETLGAALYGAMRRRLLSAHESLALRVRGAASVSSRYVERREARLRHAAGRLHALSPLATVARGFAVARGPSGETLSTVGAFTPGSRFSLLVRDGTVHAATLATDASPPAANPGPRSA